MLVKSASGTDVQATARGQGIYNTVAGSLGIASFLGLNANNGTGLLGLGGNNGTMVTEKMFYESEIGNMKDFFNYAMDTEKRICALENRVSVDETAIAKNFEISNLNDTWQNKLNDAKFEYTDLLEQCRINEATCRCIKGEVYASPSVLADPYKGRNLYIGTYAGDCGWGYGLCGYNQVYNTGCGCY